ncbi:hypothetical protein Lal_00015034 [Lupinus albus]|nr:hypothetical protein Lal_00015034 [Lupinus albus]
MRMRVAAERDDGVQHEVDDGADEGAGDGRGHGRQHAQRHGREQERVMPGGAGGADGGIREEAAHAAAFRHGSSPLDAAEQQDRRRERRIAGHVDAVQDRADDEPHGARQREDGDGDAQVGPDAQRQRGKAGDAFQREVPQLPARKLGRAGRARRPPVFDGGRLEADPREQALHEAARFRQRFQRVRDVTGEQAEVADVFRDRQVGHVVVDAVEELRRQPFQQRIGLAVRPLGQHDVIPFAPFFDQLADDVRRVLQVGVERHDQVAARFEDGGRQRGLLAEIAREIDDAHARIRMGLRDEAFQRAVAAAVVHAQDLEPDVRDAFEFGDHAAEEMRDHLLLVIERHDEGEQGRARRAGCNFVGNYGFVGKAHIDPSTTCSARKRADERRPRPRGDDGGAGSELVRQPREVRRAVQAELHAFILEAIVRLVRILLGRMHVEDVRAADGQLGFFAERPREREVGRRLRLVVLVRHGRTGERAQRLRTVVDDAEVRFQLAQRVVEVQRGLAARAALFDEQALAFRQQHVFVAGQRGRGMDARHFGLAEVHRQVRVQLAAAERRAVRCGQVQALRARVDGVHEELRLAHAQVLQDGAQGRVVVGVEAARQHDAVVDLDVVQVGRDGDGVRRRPRRAQREALRFLFMQLRDAGRVGDLAAVRREHDVHRHAADEVGERGREIYLLQRRRAEARAGRGAQQQVVRRLEGAGQLAGRRRAEVGIALVAHGRLQLGARGNVRLEVEVGGAAVTVAVGGVARLEAREALAAGIAAEAHAVDVVVRARLAREDLVILLAVFEAERGVQAAQDAVVEAAEVGVGRQLAEREAAGVELRRAGALAAVDQVQVRDRRVERVRDVVAHAVVAVGLREIAGPVADAGAVADDAVAVVDVAVDERDEAVRVHGGRVARRDVVRTDAAARPGGRRRVAGLGAGRQVQLAGTDGEFAVHVDGFVLRLGVADDAQAARVGAVGAAAVVVFARDAQHAVRHGHAAVRGREPVLAVVLRIFAETGDGFAAQVLAQFHVDDAGDGVRAVLRGGAVAQHLHVLDGEDGDRVHVRARVAAIARAEQVHEGRGVAALAVHEHEGLVGAEAAQRGRVDQVGTVGARLARRVERRRDVGQRLRQVELAALLGGLRQRDVVDRDRGIGGRRVADAARADDVDALDAVVAGGGRILCGGGRREGQYRAAVQAQQDGLADRAEGRTHGRDGMALRRRRCRSPVPRARLARHGARPRVRLVGTVARPRRRAAGQSGADGAAVGAGRHPAVQRRLRARLRQPPSGRPRRAAARRVARSVGLQRPHAGQLPGRQPRNPPGRLLPPRARRRAARILVRPLLRPRARRRRPGRGRAGDRHRDHRAGRSGTGARGAAAPAGPRHVALPGADGRHVRRHLQHERRLERDAAGGRARLHQGHVRADAHLGAGLRAGGRTAARARRDRRGDRHPLRLRTRTARAARGRQRGLGAVARRADRRREWRGRGVVRRRQRHHRAQDGRGKAEGVRPPQGRIPRHAGARAEESAGADRHGGHAAADGPPGPGAGARDEPDHRPPGRPHDGTDRRSAGRVARHARPDHAGAHGAGREGHRARRRGAGGAARRGARPHAGAGPGAGRHARAGRPQASRAGRQQHPQQRRQVHARGRHDPRDRHGGRRPRDGRRHRRRGRHDAGHGRARVRPVRAGRAHFGPVDGRARAGPRARQEPRRTAWRHGQLRQSGAGTGQHVPRAPAAAGGRMGAGGPGAGRARRGGAARAAHPRRGRQCGRGRDARHAAGGGRAPRVGGARAAARARACAGGAPARLPHRHRPAGHGRQRARAAPARRTGHRRRAARRHDGLRPGQRPAPLAGRGLRPPSRQAARPAAAVRDPRRLRSGLSRGTHRRRCQPHPGADVADRRRRVRRTGLFQVREHAAHGRVQVPRRLQRAVEIHARAASRRRRRVLVGEPRSGHRTVRAAARHSRHDRDAAGRARRQGRRHARLRRQRRPVRPLHGRPRSDRPRPRAQARPHPDPAVRPSGRDRGPGHGREGVVRGGRRAGRVLRVPWRRRAAVRLRAVHARAGAVVPPVRRGTGGGQRRPAIVPHGDDRAHRHPADHRGRRPDPAPGQPHVPDHPARRRRHPDGRRRRTGGMHALLCRAHEDRRGADRLPRVRGGAAHARRIARQEGRDSRQRRQYRPGEAGQLPGRLKKIFLKTLSISRHHEQADLRQPGRQGPGQIQGILRGAGLYVQSAVHQRERRLHGDRGRQHLRDAADGTVLQDVRRQAHRAGEGRDGSPRLPELRDPRGSRRAGGEGRRGRRPGAAAAAGPRVHADDVALGIFDEGDVAVLPDRELVLEDAPAVRGGARRLDGAVGAAEIDDRAVAAGLAAFHPDDGAGRAARVRVAREGPHLQAARRLAAFRREGWYNTFESKRFRRAADEDRVAFLARADQAIAARRAALAQPEAQPQQRRQRARRHARRAVFQRRVEVVEVAALERAVVAPAPGVDAVHANLVAPRGDAREVGCEAVQRVRIRHLDEQLGTADGRHARRRAQRRRRHAQQLRGGGRVDVRRRHRLRGEAHVIIVFRTHQFQHLPLERRAHGEGDRVRRAPEQDGRHGQRRVQAQRTAHVRVIKIHRPRAVPGYVEIDAGRAARAGEGLACIRTLVFVLDDEGRVPRTWTGAEAAQRMDVHVWQGRVARGRTGGPGRATGLHGAGADGRVLAGRRRARACGSEAGKAAVHRRRAFPFAASGREPRALAPAAGAQPQRLRQPVRADHAGPHAQRKGHVPAAPVRLRRAAGRPRAPARHAGLPRHPAARVPRPPAGGRRPPAPPGRVAGADLSRPRVAGPHVAAPRVRRRAPRRHRGSGVAARHVHRRVRPRDDARALAQTPAGHDDGHPRRQARGPMRLRTGAERGAAPALARAPREHLPARGAGRDGAHRGPVHVLAGRAALRIPGRSGPGRPHGGHLSARADVDRCAPALPGRHPREGAGADRVRTRADRGDALRALLPHRVRHRAPRALATHPVPGPRLGRQFRRVLLPGHHGSRPGARQPAVRALHLERTQRAARHRRRLRAPAPRGSHPVHLPQVRTHAGGAGGRRHQLPAEKRAARQRPRARRRPRHRGQGVQAAPLVRQQGGPAEPPGRERARSAGAAVAAMGIAGAALARLSPPPVAASGRVRDGARAAVAPRAHRERDDGRAQRDSVGQGRPRGTGPHEGRRAGARHAVDAAPRAGTGRPAPRHDVRDAGHPARGPAHLCDDPPGGHGRRLPDRIARADEHAAADEAQDVLRPRDPGGDRAARPHPGRHGAPVPAAARAEGARQVSQSGHAGCAGTHARGADLPGAGDAGGDPRGRLHARRGGPAAPRDGRVEAQGRARKILPAHRRRHAGERLRPVVRGTDLQPDPGLWRIRLSRIARGQLRAARVRQFLAQVPRARRVPVRAAEQPADGLLQPVATRAGCAPARHRPRRAPGPAHAARDRAGGGGTHRDRARHASVRERGRPRAPRGTRSRRPAGARGRECARPAGGPPPPGAVGSGGRRARQGFIEAHGTRRGRARAARAAGRRGDRRRLPRAGSHAGPPSAGAAARPAAGAALPAGRRAARFSKRPAGARLRHRHRAPASRHGEGRAVPDHRGRDGQHQRDRVAAARRAAAARSAERLAAGRVRRVAARRGGAAPRRQAPRRHVAPARQARCAQSRLLLVLPARSGRAFATAFVGRSFIIVGFAPARPSIFFHDTRTQPALGPGHRHRTVHRLPRLLRRLQGRECRLSRHVPHQGLLPRLPRQERGRQGHAQARIPACAVHAVRGRAVPEGVPDRIDQPRARRRRAHRRRQLRPVARLHRRVPVRRHPHRPGRAGGGQMRLLQPPARRRPAARVRGSVPRRRVRVRRRERPGEQHQPLPREARQGTGRAQAAGRHAAGRTLPWHRHRRAARRREQAAEGPQPRSVHVEDRHVGRAARRLRHRRRQRDGQAEGRQMMERRGFLKSGLGALATLAVGETILLAPGDAVAGDAAAVADPLNYAVDADGKARKRHVDYRTATAVKSVCLNCSTLHDVREGAERPHDQHVSGAPAVPAQARGQAGRRLVAAHHVGRGGRRDRVPHPQEHRGRPSGARGDPPGPLALRGGVRPLPECRRLARAAEPPRPVFREQARRQLREPRRDGLGIDRRGALPLLPELRRQFLRSPPGRAAPRQARRQGALRPRRQARDVRRAPVQHGGPQRRVVPAASRHGRRHRARDGARDPAREPARPRVHRRLRAARRSATARLAEGLHAGVGAGPVGRGGRGHRTHRHRVRARASRRRRVHQPRHGRALQRLQQRTGRRHAQRAGRLRGPAGRLLLRARRKAGAREVPGAAAGAAEGHDPHRPRRPARVAAGEPLAKDEGGPGRVRLPGAGQGEAGRLPELHDRGADDVAGGPHDRRPRAGGRKPDPVPRVLGHRVFRDGALVGPDPAGCDLPRTVGHGHPQQPRAAALRDAAPADGPAAGRGALVPRRAVRRGPPPRAGAGEVFRVRHARGVRAHAVLEAARAGAGRPHVRVGLRLHEALRRARGHEPAQGLRGVPPQAGRGAARGHARGRRGPHPQGGQRRQGAQGARDRPDGEGRAAARIRDAVAPLRDPRAGSGAGGGAGGHRGRRHAGVPSRPGPGPLAGRPLRADDLQMERAHAGPHGVAEIPVRDRARQPDVDASAGRAAHWRQVRRPGRGDDLPSPLGQAGRRGVPGRAGRTGRRRGPRPHPRVRHGRHPPEGAGRVEFAGLAGGRARRAGARGRARRGAGCVRPGGRAQGPGAGPARGRPGERRVVGRAPRRPRQRREHQRHPARQSGAAGGHAVVVRHGLQRAQGLRRLVLHRGRRRGRFLDERRVLLRHLVHLADGLVDLLDAVRLLLRGARDLGHDVGHAADAGDDVAHRGAGLVDELRARVHVGRRRGDQVLDFLGRGGRALREAAHFRRHHREAAALFARARRFHGRVQREDVGLEGDAVDDADDVRDAAGRRVDGAHRRDDFADDRAAPRGDFRRGDGELVRLARIVRVLAHGRRQFFHRRGRLFQRAGLLLGAGRQVQVAGADLARRGRDGIGTAAHPADDADQAVVHVAQGAQQGARLVGGARFDGVRQVAGRHRLRHGHGGADRQHDAAREQPRRDGAEHQRQRREQHDQAGAARRAGVDRGGGGVDAGALHGDEVLQQALVFFRGRRERLVEDARRFLRVAVGLGLDGAVARRAVRLALFEDPREQIMFRTARRDQGLDLLEQFGGALHGGRRVVLEVGAERRIRALDDGGRAADRRVVQAVPVRDHALLRERYAHHRPGRAGDVGQAPRADGGDRHRHREDEGKAQAEAAADLHVCNESHRYSFAQRQQRRGVFYPSYLQFGIRKFLKATLTQHFLRSFREPPRELLNDPLSHLDASVSVKKGGGIVHPFFFSGRLMKSSRILRTTLFLAGVAGNAAAGAAALPAPFAEQLNASYPAIETLYQDLHRNPELGFDEHQTAARLAERAKALGFDVTTGVGGTGVVAILRNGPGPTVMLRTELDALPVQEKTSLPFASKATAKNAAGETVPVMHACGHDLHMSAWYGTAKLMAANRTAWSGTLMLVGQPSEEPVNGAAAMLKDGLFTRFPKPDYALSFHDDATMPSGTIMYHAGPFRASSDVVSITVFGQGGHGAVPHEARDPIVMAARIVLALQTLVSRENNPIDPVVITVGSIHGGTQANIIPDQVTLQLSVRTFKPEVRKRVLASIAREAKGEAIAAGAPKEPLVEVKPGDAAEDDVGRLFAVRPAAGREGDPAARGRRRRGPPGCREEGRPTAAGHALAAVGAGLQADRRQHHQGRDGDSARPDAEEVIRPARCRTLVLRVQRQRLPGDGEEFFAQPQEAAGRHHGVGDGPRAHVDHEFLDDAQVLVLQVVDVVADQGRRAHQFRARSLASGCRRITRVRRPRPDGNARTRSERFPLLVADRRLRRRLLHGRLRGHDGARGGGDRYGGRGGLRRLRSRRRVRAEAEQADHFGQLVGLLAQGAGGRGRFLDEGGIVLRGRIHVGDGFVDLLDAGALLAAGAGDLGDDVAHLADAVDHVAHRAACLVDQLGAVFDLADGIDDQLLDFLRGRGRALGQRAHLARHDGEAAALFAGARRFDGRVQRQDVGLERDAVDDADDVDDLLGRIVDRAHRLHDLVDDGAALRGDFRCGDRQLAGLARVVRVLAHGAGQFLDRAGRRAERAGLLFGARGQVHVAGRDFRRCRRDGVGAAADLGDDGDEAVVHVAQRAQQGARFAVAARVDLLGKVAAGHFLGQFHGLADRTDDGVRQHPRAHGAEQHGDAGHDHDRARAVAAGVVDFLRDGVDVGLLHLDEFGLLAFVRFRRRHVFLVQDALGGRRVAVGLGLDGPFLGRRVGIAQFRDAGEQRAFLVAVEQRFDLLQQLDRAVGRAHAVGLEEVDEAGVRALDDGGRTAHGGERLHVPFFHHAFLGERDGHHRARGIGDRVQAPDGGGRNDEGQAQHEGKTHAETFRDIHVGEKTHSILPYSSNVIILSAGGAARGRGRVRQRPRFRFYARDALRRVGVRGQVGRGTPQPARDLAVGRLLAFQRFQHVGQAVRRQSVASQDPDRVIVRFQLHCARILHLRQHGRHAGGDGAEVAEQRGRHGGRQRRSRHRARGMAALDVAHFVADHAQQPGLADVVEFVVVVQREAHHRVGHDDGAVRQRERVRAQLVGRAHEQAHGQARVRRQGTGQQGFHVRDTRVRQARRRQHVLRFQARQRGQAQPGVDGGRQARRDEVGGGRHAPHEAGAEQRQQQHERQQGGGPQGLAPFHGALAVTERGQQRVPIRAERHFAGGVAQAQQQRRAPERFGQHDVRQRIGGRRGRRRNGRLPRQVHPEEIGHAVAGCRHAGPARREHGLFEAVRRVDGDVGHAVAPGAHDRERAEQAERQQGQQHVHGLQAQIGPDPHRARDAHAREGRGGPRQVVHADEDVRAHQQHGQIHEDEGKDGGEECHERLPAGPAREEDGRADAEADDHHHAEADQKRAHVRPGQVARLERERGALVAHHQVLVLVHLHRAMHQRPAQVQQEDDADEGIPGHQRDERAGQHEDRHRHEVHDVRLPNAAPKAERQAAVERVRQAEAQRGPHHEGQAGQQQRDGDDAHLQRQAERVVIEGQQHHGEDAPAQDRLRVAAEVEAGAGELGVAVKVLQAAGLGPRRIDAQRGHREQQVDDPDAEIFRAAAGERQAMRGRLGERSVVGCVHGTSVATVD